MPRSAGGASNVARGPLRLNGRGSASVGAGAEVGAVAEGDGQPDVHMEKQKELEHIVDRHDDLVRELFQMDKFRNMLLYDPKVAKEDKTAVFQEFKAKYDLVDNTAPVAGPSRQTRGRLLERRQIISAPVATKKRKTEARTVDGLKEIIDIANGKGKGKAEVPVPDIPKGHKGKARALDVLAKESVSAPGIAAAESTSNQAEVAPKAARKGKAGAHVLPNEVPATGRKRKAEQVDPDPDPSIGQSIRVIRKPTVVVDALDDSTPKRKPKATVDAQPDVVPLSGKKGKGKKSEETTPASHPSSVRVVAEPAPTPNRRKVIPAKRTAPIPVEVLEQDKTVPHLPSESISTSRKRSRTRAREPLSTFIPPTITPPAKSTVSLKLGPSKTSLSIVQDIPPQPPSPPKIKRIKLIVRRPPLPITNPKQRPPPPKYDESLTKFLTSYVSLEEEEEDVDITNLHQQIRDEASIREQVVHFRAQGRFIPGADVLFGSQPHEDVYTGPAPRSTRDTWDDIVDAIVARGRAQKAKVPRGRRIAAQIASRVQAHFGGQEARKQKAVENEEKRLRVLARTTLKAVTAEWKKAVYHIREKQRLEAEAEERRLGHIHLDAILNQSGAILETQHGDLARASGSRSRSGSIGEFYDSGREDEESNEEPEDSAEEDEIQHDIDDRASVSMRSANEEDERREDVDVDDTDGVASEREEQLSNGVEDGDEEDDNDDDADEEEGTTSLLLDEKPAVLSSMQAAPSSSSASPPTPEALPVPSEHDDVDVIPAPPPPHTGNALNALSMYDDSDSDTDVADLIAHNPEESPQKSQDLPHSDSILASPTPTSREHPDMLEAGREPLEDDSTAPMTPEPMAVDEPAALDEAQTPASDTPAMDTTQEGEPSEVASPAPEDSPEAPQSEAEGAASDLEADEGEDAGGDEEDNEESVEVEIPGYLHPYAVAPVEWDPEAKVSPPLLLRGVLRPYQQSGLEWLASLHTNKLNGILADEMGLGKTIQTISLLAHLACDRGIWGPHLIVVPTSVLLNWEMEFKKFLPGFRVLSYHGSQKRRKELRQGWNDKYQFNVCITSYTLASKDAHIFKRKAWYYMILDEAHMIKNFKSQRWNILLMFRSYRRLLLTGTPLQNNLTELWALLQFLMSGANFANLKEFGEWFSNPLEKAIEMGNAFDDETMQRVSKLHTVLRPYLLRRLKRDVEKELPSKFEHLTLCPLSKRQRFLYDEFMSRAQTRDALESGVYQKIANILMQLRKVCNHPDLFEVRPIVTSFAMPQSAVASFEIKELLIRRRFFEEQDETVNLDVVGLQFIDRQNVSLLSAVESRRLDSTKTLSCFKETAGEPPPNDTRTMAGFRKYAAYMRRANAVARWAHAGYLNRLRCAHIPIFSSECISVVERMTTRIQPFSDIESRQNYMDTPDTVNKSVKSYAARAAEMAPLVDHFAFVTPAVVAPDLPRLALAGHSDVVEQLPLEFDAILHRAAVKKQIAFPDPSLLQYDCGKLQKLASLLREKKAGGHRVLIFTQMTRILDILEIFLNFNGHLYLRLDGATKIEDRQYITERFNADPRIFCFIASSRSGGVGINLTGADTVIFYDSDFNPQMDRQCEDRAHRIGQIRDVHIYRFVSQYTVEEAMLLKANQKRSLDDIVIQKGEFDWRSLFNDEGALTKALGDLEDAEDRHAAAVAAREEYSLVGADEADFAEVDMAPASQGAMRPIPQGDMDEQDEDEASDAEAEAEAAEEDDDDDDQGGSIADYMLAFVERDLEFFDKWRL